MYTTHWNYIFGCLVASVYVTMHFSHIQQCALCIYVTMHFGAAASSIHLRQLPDDDMAIPNCIAT